MRLHNWGKVSSSMVGLSCLLLGLTSAGQAQMPPITPSGLSTQVNLSATPPAGQIQYDITGGTRAGANLFHSFGDFNVPTNNIANFFNESGASTSNILGRVTAGNPSSIFGTIQTTSFGSANLFLMNPAGIVFGPNATLNVGGSVTFTTASYLRLAEVDGTNAGIFHADPSLASLLSSAPVAAYGFLASNPAAISAQGSTLGVLPGQSISLVAGNQGFTYTDPDTGLSASVPNGVTVVGGTLSAPGGQVNLVSVASPGEVLSSGFNYGPNIMGAEFTSLGTVSLTEGALVDVSADSAGTVKIRGGALVVENSTVAANTGDVDGAPIAIDIDVTGAVSLSNTNISALAAMTSGAGNAGDIMITSGSLNASFGSDDFSAALIDSHTLGTGHGGNVTVTTGPLTMNGNPFTPGYFIDSGTLGEGNGGNVSITAGDVHITSAGTNTGDNTFSGLGNGGNLKIKSDSLVLETVTLQTDSLFAQAGAIDLESSGLLRISGNSFVSNTSLLGGNPITIKADRFVLSDISLVLAGTALLDGGDVSVTARIVELSSGGALGTQTFGDGKAGDIYVTATERVSLLNNPDDFRPSGLFAQSLGLPDADNPFGVNGHAGNITINTPRLELTNGARINSATLTSGHGGDVIITAAESISITGERSFDVPEEGFFGLGGTRASGIYTSTLGNEICLGPCGNAGNINITTGSMTLQNGGLIDSGTTNNGTGGNITVNAASSISISGTMTDGTPSGIYSRTIGTDPDAGNGGGILLKANSIMIQDGAQLSASSLGPGASGSVTVEGTSSPADSVLIDGAGSGIFTDTQGTGAGGNILVHANTVTLQNGGTLSAKTSGPEATATGGTITVNATDQVSMRSGATITASSAGLADAGDIAINAGQRLDMRDSSIKTEAAEASGGNIDIQAVDRVRLVNSTVSTSVLGGSGGGGNITIDPTVVVLQNSQVIAQAVQGAGGNITITTPLFLADSTSIVSASSQFGLNGTVTIQSPTSNLSGTVASLPSSLRQAQGLQTGRCAALYGNASSSFVVAGRETLPTEPGSWLTSPLDQTGGNRPVFADAVTEPLRPAKPMKAFADGTISLRQLTPAGFLTQSFSEGESTGCRS